MRAFLLFRLYGPLVSWGEIAVGERRGTWSRPSKSAVLGLIAAALGVERDDRERHMALAEGYGFAVRVDASGQPLRDYHTAQTAKEADLNKVRKKDPRPLTRRAVLSVDDPVTILSQRDYYLDALYTIALWSRAGAPHSLGELRAALLRPRFTLYLGRKSCPPALPLAPDVIEAPHLPAALTAYPPAPESLVPAHREARPLLAWEDDVVPAEIPGIRRLHVERRRDTPTDRRRWYFADRNEQVAILEALGES
jgi:CRISPR system Cascade subunit CasD